LQFIFEMWSRGQEVGDVCIVGGAWGFVDPCWKQPHLSRTFAVMTNGALLTHHHLWRRARACNKINNSPAECAHRHTHRLSLSENRGGRGNLINTSEQVITLAALFPTNFRPNLHNVMTLALDKLLPQNMQTSG